MHGPIVVAVLVAFHVVVAGHDEDAALEADDEAATSAALGSCRSPLPPDGFGVQFAARFAST